MLTNSSRSTIPMTNPRANILYKTTNPNPKSSIPPDIGQFHKSATPKYQRLFSYFHNQAHSYTIHQTRQNFAITHNFESSMFPIDERAHSLSDADRPSLPKDVDRARIETVTDTPETLLTQSGKKGTGRAKSQARP